MTSDAKTSWELKYDDLPFDIKEVINVHLTNLIINERAKDNHKLLMYEYEGDIKVYNTYIMPRIHPRAYTNWIFKFYKNQWKHFGNKKTWVGVRLASFECL